MLRLVVYGIVALVAIGAIIAGAFPHSPASVVHDGIAGWHWVVQFYDTHLKHAINARHRS